MRPVRLLWLLPERRLQLFRVHLLLLYQQLPHGGLLCGRSQTADRAEKRLQQWLLPVSRSRQTAGDMLAISDRGDGRFLPLPA